MIQAFFRFLHWYMFAWKVAWWTFRTHAHDRAWIMERQGAFYDLYFAKRKFTTGQGYHLEYEGQSLTVATEQGETEDKANNPPAQFFDDDLLYGVADGQVFSCPFKGEAKSHDVSAVSLVMRGKIAAELLHEYSEPKGMGQAGGWLKWVIIIAIAALIAFLVWHFGFHGNLPHIGTAVQPTPTPGGTPSGGHLATPTPIYHY